MLGIFRRNHRNLHFYCYNSDCFNTFEPRSLEDMSYGCWKCTSPSLYKDLPESVKNRLPSVLTQIWEVRPPCLQHRVFPIVPRCPICTKPIRERGFCSPVGVWSPKDAGKTVYWAVLAHKIEEGALFEQTGLRAQFLVNRVATDQSVRALFEDGLLPDKTGPGEYRKLALTVQGEGWTVRDLVLTDMAGEIYRAVDTNVDEEGEHRRQTIMLTRDSIFLADPATPGLGGSVAVDLFGVLRELLQDVQGIGILRGCSEDVVKRLVRAMERILGQSKYPYEGAVGHGDTRYKTLAMELFQVIQQFNLLPSSTDTALIDALRESLEWAATVMRNRVPFEEQLEEIINNMQQWGYKRRRGKLDHRIAITVSKADLLQIEHLKGLSQTYDNILRQHRLPARASADEWQKALRKISQVSRNALWNGGEKQFVKFVEGEFSEVSFFFVSSLGRKVEIFVRQGDPISQGVRPALGAPHQPLVDAPQGPRWELWKRVQSDPTTGHAPAPQHILLPLIWILTGREV